MVPPERPLSRFGIERPPRPTRLVAPRGPRIAVCMLPRSGGHYLSGPTVGKSRLSTAEMKRLRKAGINLSTIAKLAGITLQGVRYRVNPKYQYNPDAYVYAPDGKYLRKQRERQREYQEISVKHARNFGAWMAKEIRFLKKNAPLLT